MCKFKNDKCKLGFKGPVLSVQKIRINNNQHSYDDYYEFDLKGYLIKEKSFGTEYSCENKYDDKNRLIEQIGVNIRDQSKIHRLFTYEEEGRLNYHEYSVYSRTEQFRIDESFWGRKICDCSYKLDNGGRLIELSEFEEENVSKFEYNQQGLIISEIHTNQGFSPSKKYYYYDSSDNIIRSEWFDHCNRLAESTYLFYKNGQVFEKKVFASDGTIKIEIQYEYDKIGNAILKRIRSGGKMRLVCFEISYF